MTESGGTAPRFDKVDVALEAWDRLLKAFESLPSDDAKRGFLEYTNAVRDFNKLRGYLAGNQSENATSPLHGFLAAMKLDEERLWAQSKSGQDEIAASLFLFFQGLSSDAERVAFAQFAEAVIEYHITKYTIGPTNWRNWSM